MQRRHRAAHRRIWGALLVLLPLILLASLGLRRTGPSEAAAILLVPPALLLPLFDGLDRERNFTAGYLCVARKRA